MDSDGRQATRGEGGGPAAPDSADALLRLGFRSQDPDEVHAYIAPRFGDHTRIPHRGLPFGFGFAAVAARRVTMGLTHLASAQTVRAAVRAPTLLMYNRDHGRLSVGRRQFEIRSSTVALLAPGHEYTLVTGRHTSLGLRLDDELLRERIEARTRGRSRRWLLQSQLFPVDAASLGQLRALGARLFAAARRGADAAAFDTGAFEHEVADLVAALALGQSALVPGALDCARRVERVERWVEQHLAEDITLDRLCAVAGVRWRSLQKAFVAVRGQSPLEFVESRRLAAVRARLLRADPPAMVSYVALDHGFTHLGRFAARYRRVYGEAPSETARRAAGAHARSGTSDDVRA